MLAANILLFGQLLRRAGLDVHAGRLLDAIEALAIVGLGRRDDVRCTLRTLLVHRQEDLPLFDRAFEEFFRRRGALWGRADLRSLGEARSHVELRFAVPALADGAPPVGQDEDEDQAPSHVVGRRTWSARDAFRQKSFEAYTEREILDATAALAALRWDPGVRLTRRWVPGTGARLDLRRLLRRNLGTGGELLYLPRQKRRQHVRPLVVVADISGSMERYSRMLLHFVHALFRRRRRVEAFLFATRLSRITAPLRHANPDEAVQKVGRLVHDWAGGTRIGDSLRALNVTWGRRVLSRGAVVLIVSDGWDRGDPATLSREIAHLRRSCHRLIWLNPLLGTPGYEPLTRGMQAARPHLDDFLPAHNLASLEDLAERLNSLSGTRRPRRAGSRPTLKRHDASTAAVAPWRVERHEG